MHIQNKKNILFLSFSFLLVSGLFSQIPPGYYDGAEGLQGDQLKAALHNIIDDHTWYSYNDLRDFILKDTDEDPDNSNNVILLYTGRSQAKSTFGGGANDWNREHVWAKSHGGFGNNPPAGTDAHHIRPTDASVNSSRGNKDFAMGGQEHSEATGNYYTAYTWEPRDAVKGDVARMIFYMATRYEGGSGEPDLEVVDAINTSPNPEHGKLSDLLNWNQQDPPDDFEINRNNVIYGYQNNRNPFIDHPEYVNAIWNPVSVQDNTLEENAVIIFPLPADNYLNIQFDIPVLSSLSLTITDLLGKTVLSETVSIDGDIVKADLTSIPNGLYILGLHNEEISINRKIQVSHK
ncbi:MAG: T9SS type A sorting domain-containing protein [Chlorobi bacterium]|nr:T9SS type A sorting domain-containing protein [Chlorobiota bacterium]